MGGGKLLFLDPYNSKKQAPALCKNHVGTNSRLSRMGSHISRDSWLVGDKEKQAGN